MRKFFVALTCLFIAVSAMAIPAHRGSATVTQPDGSKLTIQLVGDEFYSFNTTTDGYTVVKDARGIYVYAVRNGEGLAASAVKAHNVAERTAAEKSFLAQMECRITDRAERKDGEARRARRDAPSTQAFNYNGFRGLIILVNFTDVKFSMVNPNDFYDMMVNDEGFTGYYDENAKWVSCTGSMYDYYNENSNGVFKPKFDIVGPIEVNYKSTDMKRTSNAQTIFRAAIAAAHNAGCNFANYDADNNGYVDMVFFQCAGMSSSFSGNNDNWLWPHKSSLYGVPSYNGKRFSLYACSTEIYGWESVPSLITIEGIGTMCHEFTHVMGFPDLYDTDYESNGQSHHPGDWDIMAGGGSFNSARTPVGYTIFERYALGFARPTEITEPGEYTLPPVMSNQGYIMRSPVLNEYFIIDNRQKTRWDAYLPGHGMIVCRVDSTNASVWKNNSINSNSNRNYYEMLRAGNSTDDAKASDPFPGSYGVTELSSATTPALKTYSGKTCELGFFNIKETGGNITFTVKKEAEITKDIEDFEPMPVTTNKTEQGVQGSLTSWDFNQCCVVEDNGNGTKGVAMVSPSALTMAKSTYYASDRITIDVYNTSTSTAKFTLTQNSGEGVWVKIKDASGSTSTSVPGNSSRTITYPVSTLSSTPVKYRIQQTAGSKTVPVIIDDFVIYYSEKGANCAVGDVNGDGVIDMADLNVIINVMLGYDSPASYGDRVDVNGDDIIDIADVNAVLKIMLNK